MIVDYLDLNYISATEMCDILRDFGFKASQISDLIFDWYL